MSDDTDPTDDVPETARVRVVDKAHTRVTFEGETLEYGDEGEVRKSVMRAGCPRGAYIRLDGCQAEIEDEGRGLRSYGAKEGLTRPCTNDAKESGEHCGVHS